MKINLLDKFDTKDKEVIKNFGKIAVITAGLLVAKGMLPESVLASVGDEASSKANQIGYEIWKVLNTAAKWTMGFFVAKEVIESLNDGDHKAIGKIVFKYALAYGVIVFIIKIFEWINAMAQK